MNMFEKASRFKLRFYTDIGALGTEQLWDLPLQSATRVNLDDLAKDVNSQLQESSEDSFVSPEQKKNESLELALEILKHVIQIKLEEAKEKEAALQKKQRKAKILEVIGQKEDEALSSLPLDELKKMIEDV